MQRVILSVWVVFLFIAIPVSPAVAQPWMPTRQPPGAGCPPIPAGTDVFPSTAKLVVQLDTLSDPFVVRLSSADLSDTVVQRQAQVGDVIDVELQGGEMRGFHPQFGTVEVRIGSNYGLAPSLGQLTHVTQDPASCELISADSFFDVVAEISAYGLGQAWTTNIPIHLERRITRLPPEDERYENPFIDTANPIRLVDISDGTEVGTLLYELHHADPPFPPGPDCFDSFLNLFAQIPPLGFFGTLFAQGPTTIAHGAGQATGSCSLTPQACRRDADCPLGEVCVLTSNLFQQQITEMELQGFDPFIGGFTIRVRPNPPSLGQTTSQNPGHGTYAADSFFDVFFDISLDDLGAVLRNPDSDPATMVAGPNPPSIGVRNIPPDPQSSFLSPAGLPISLITEAGEPAGQISDLQHIIDVPKDWEPPPPADEDCFDSWVLLELTIFSPFCQETLMLPGHFKVLRDDPVDPGGTGQEIIDLLMVKGLFEAESQCIGPLTMRLDPALPSEGRVSSLAPEEFFPADSFFDIEMVIDTGIGQLTPGDPSHMTTTINSLPPEEGEIYFGPGTVIPLFDDKGTQIGEILEVSHEIHKQIECPIDCGPRIDWQSKIEFDAGIPGAGGGAKYDAVRGDLHVLRATDGSFASAFLIGFNTGPLVSASANPFPGSGYYYLARDHYGAYRGSWNSGGPSQVADRDPLLP